MAQLENTQQVALLRGINVGRAKRVAMADLRKLLGDLGFTQVRTVLNSGNAVYDGGAVAPAEAAARIEEALVLKLGVAARVTVLSASQFAELIEQNHPGAGGRCGPLADLGAEQSGRCPAPGAALAAAVAAGSAGAGAMGRVCLVPRGRAGQQGGGGTGCRVGRWRHLAQLGHHAKIACAAERARGGSHIVIFQGALMPAIETP